MECLEDGCADFEWGLGEPGEPPLPGGVIDQIIEKLNEVHVFDLFELLSCCHLDVF